MAEVFYAGDPTGIIDETVMASGCIYNPIP
jgi:hypothetical protein